MRVRPSAQLRNTCSLLVARRREILLVSLTARPSFKPISSTERNGRLQVSSSMRLGADLTPLEFSVKGKSYRFVNVDAAVKVVGGVATVTSLGETKTFEAPRRFFTAQSYAPLSARAQLVNYWQKQGRPETLPVLPGEPTRDVHIEQRGTDTVASGGKSTLRRFSVTACMGRETVWIAARPVCASSRGPFLPLEACARI